jgi:hypothetical protein
MTSSQRSIVPRRVAGVTVALAGTGAVLGAGFSAAAAGIVGVAARLLGTPAVVAPVAVLAGIGGALGALLTPLTAFSLLRRVALGKAVLATMLGMALATSVGYVATGGRIPIAVAAGVAGFLVTALLLRLRAGTPKAPATKESE